MTMSQTEILAALRAFRLTEGEWNTLTVLRDIEEDPEGCGMTTPEAKREWCRVNKGGLDMLILAGLVHRGSIVELDGSIDWLDSCFVTEEGQWAASAVNMIFDWDDFTFDPEAEETDTEGSVDPHSVAAGCMEGVHFV